MTAASPGATASINPDTSRISEVLRAPQFTREELSEAMRARNDVPLFDFAMTVALAFVPPLALYLYPSIWVGILCAILNIHVFNRCAQIVHGSDHDALFANKKFDHIIGQVAGYFVGYQRQGHKETHDEHHLYLNSERDADRVWCEPEAKVSSMARGWIRDALLISAVRRFVQYVPGRFSQPGDAVEKPAFGKRLRSFWGMAISFAPVALVQSILVLAYVAAADFDPVIGIVYYLLIHVATLFVLYPMQIRIRSNVEHSFVPGYQCVTSQDRRVVRSVDASWLERMIIAPLNGQYHYEHHLVPYMPYYNAPRVREILRQKGFRIPLANGYVSFIWRKWRLERQMERKAPAH
jgi:fatty acid desaturase